MLSAYKGLAKRLAGVPLIASLPVISISLVLIALLTTAIGVASLVTKINHVTIIFLIPVLVAAIRGGIVPAVVAALVGIGVSAFFFFLPYMTLGSVVVCNSSIWLCLFSLRS